MVAGGALTSVFSHVLASLSTEAQARFPEPRVHIKVEGVESLFSRIGAVYSFAGPLAGDRDFAAFMVYMYGGGSRRKMFRINHSSDIVPKVCLKPKHVPHVLYRASVCVLSQNMLGHGSSRK